MKRGLGAKFRLGFLFVFLRFPLPSMGSKRQVERRGPKEQSTIEENMLGTQRAFETEESYTGGIVSA